MTKDEFRMETIFEIKVDRRCNCCTVLYALGISTASLRRAVMDEDVSMGGDDSSNFPRHQRPWVWAAEHKLQTFRHYVSVYKE